MKRPQYIFIHHTAVSHQKNPNQWKATDSFHRGKGWGGGGYNYEIAADGSIHQFRADGTITAAQYQQNMNDGRAISICLDGNFDIEDPTPEQKKTVATLIKAKMDQYGIPKSNVFCHRKVATYKSCPGSRLPDNIFNYFIPMTQEIPDWGKEPIQKATQKGIILGGNILEDVSPQEMEEALYKLGIIQQKLGGLSRVRFLAALDKAHLLD